MSPRYDVGLDGCVWRRRGSLLSRLKDDEEEDFIIVRPSRSRRRRRLWCRWWWGRRRVGRGRECRSGEWLIESFIRKAYPVI
jgi:hypothetical protein